MLLMKKLVEVLKMCIEKKKSEKFIELAKEIIAKQEPTLVVDKKNGVMTVMWLK